MLMRLRLSGSEVGSSRPEGSARGASPSSFQWQAPVGAPKSPFWNLHGKVSKEFLFPYPADQALFIRLVLDASMFSLIKARKGFVWANGAGAIGMPGPTDGANVEANLHGLLRLGKRASNIRIVWSASAPSKVAPPDLSWNSPWGFNSRPTSDVRTVIDGGPRLEQGEHPRGLEASSRAYIKSLSHTAEDNLGVGVV
ncbi:hypothetical protein Tco_0636737 [Tanacetum coccineum]